MARDLIERLAARVLLGAFPWTAAQAEKIPNATFYRWLRLGRDALAAADGGEVPEADRPYADLVQAIEVAEADLQAALLKTVRRHAERSPQAAIALLSKRFREEWGDRARIDLNATHSAEAEMSDEEINVEVDRIMGLLAAPEQLAAVIAADSVKKVAVEEDPRADLPPDLPGPDGMAMRDEEGRVYHLQPAADREVGEDLMQAASGGPAWQSWDGRSSLLRQRGRRG